MRHTNTMDIDHALKVLEDAIEKESQEGPPAQPQQGSLLQSLGPSLTAVASQVLPRLKDSIFNVQQLNERGHNLTDSLLDNLQQELKKDPKRFLIKVVAGALIFTALHSLFNKDSSGE